MEEAHLVHRCKPSMTGMSGLIALLLFVPFLQVFGAVSQAETVHSCLNYLSLALALVAFPGMMSRINLRVVVLCSLGVVMYSLNYVLGPFASGKWLVNTLGFLFLFMVVSNYMKTMRPQQLTSLERHLSRLMLMLWVVCACSFLAALYSYWDEIVAFTATMRFNNTIYILSRDHGLSKQSLGPFLASMGLWHMVYWKSLGRVRKVLFVFFVILSIPFFIGIRTLLLSVALLWLFLLWGSRKITFPTKFAMFILMPLAVTLILVCLGFDARSLILQRYNRLPSLLFAVETFRQYPGGLGNGGYAPFVLAQANSLFTEYGVQAYGLKRFPPAPESDIVYFIASFGVLSPVFFLFCGYILSKARRILHSRSPHRFDTFVLLFAMILIFGGISQDFAGKLAWWTYLGAATGIIFRYQAPTRITREALCVVPQYNGRMAICRA